MVDLDLGWGDYSSPEYDVIELLDKQKEVIKIMRSKLPGTRTLIGYGGAMGGGKSFLDGVVAKNLSLWFPGNRILLGRQTLTSLKTTTMERFFAVTPAPLIKKYNQQDMYVQLRLPQWPEGLFSTVYFRGLEDYEARGSEEYGAIIIDEAHEVSDDAFRYYTTRLRHRLPTFVGRRLKAQCRICGGLSKSTTCALHGDTLGNGLRLFMICTANPWPGWFTNVFYKRDDKMLEQMPGKVSIHFVQSLPSDNYHNDDGGDAGDYVAFLRASYAGQPSLIKRFVEGRFDVFTGMIYELFDADTHQWKHKDLPEYSRVVGGLDFGGESETAHFNAGIVGIYTKSGTLIRVAEFKKRGYNAAEQMMLWMYEQEQKFARPHGKKIQWRGDRTQSVGLQLMRRNGFLIQQSDGKKDSRDENIKDAAYRMALDASGRPGSYYLPELQEWRKEVQEYRRDPETKLVIRENDDLMDADLYMHEQLRSMVGDPAKLMKNAVPTMMPQEKRFEWKLK